MVVCILLCIEKFAAGAWIILLLLPIIMMIFHKISHHYLTMQRELTVPKMHQLPVATEHTVLILVASLNKGVLPALEYAKMISSRIEAVHVELNPEATEQLKRDWNEWGSGIPLTVIKSPFRSLSEPLINYIDEVERRSKHDVVTVIIPEYIPKKWWHNLLHNQTAIVIKARLALKPGKVVTTVRYHMSA
jgi:hypothetical protein